MEARQILHIYQREVLLGMSLKVWARKEEERRRDREARENLNRF